MFLNENSKRNQIWVLVSGFGISDTAGMVDGMPGGELLKRLAEVLTLFELCNRRDESGSVRFGFSVSVSGNTACQNKMGESDLVCNIMQQWFVQHGISERCIYVDRMSPNIETSVGVFWKHLQNTNMDNRTTVCIVSQTHQAISAQRLLELISQGKCLSMIRCCNYGSWQSRLSGIIRLFPLLYEYPGHRWSQLSSRIRNSSSSFARS